jgi:hypothetical protein
MRVNSFKIKLWLLPTCSAGNAGSASIAENAVIAENGLTFRNPNSAIERFASPTNQRRYLLV